tara:strand:+ start:532 stop:1113 length:582 start_codon:yes stop_codon:yes gene_type:complete
MDNFSIKDDLHYVGWVDVYKQYPDGSEYLVYSDHNIVTSGMGVTLASLFASEIQSVEDFKIDRFQIGVSGTSTDDEVVTRSALISPWAAGDYGVNTTLSLYSNNIWERGTLTAQVFAAIPSQNIVKAASDKVTFVIVLDENTGNGQNVNEVGLLSRNPLDLSPEGSVLCAYKYIPTIVKGSAFSLVIKWTIQF